jgi:enterochelin esterase-like enzyme
MNLSSVAPSKGTQNLSCRTNALYSASSAANRKAQRMNLAGRSLTAFLLLAAANVAYGQAAPAQEAKPATTTTVQQSPSAAPAPKEYKLGPDSLPQDGVPKGKLEGPFLFKSKVLEGTIRKYWVYVPVQYDAKKPACVLVFQDGQRATNPNGVLRVQNVLDNLIAKKEIPVTIGIFITPGQRGDEYQDSLGFSNPNNRSVEYDSLGDAYARFICDEMLPEVGKTYNLTKDPNGRAIGGASSGAIAAFTVAWERPNEFRRVISMIGSFTNIRGGHVYPDLVRKSDPKPIRIYIQDGANDNRNPNRPERDWYLQNQAMVAALKEKGYDMTYVFGEGNHSDNHGGAILPDMLRWLWRDYPK